MRPTSRFARLALPIAVLALSAFTWIAAELKGTYKIEITVQDQSYGGSGDIIPDGKGAFTGKFLFTSPIEVTYDMTGTQKGDSVFFDAKYNDKTNGCIGTMKGNGTAKSDGSGATGPVTIDDSCRGTITATYRLTR